MHPIYGDETFTAATIAFKFASKEDAREYQKDHRDTRIFSNDNITVYLSYPKTLRKHYSGEGNQYLFEFTTKEEARKWHREIGKVGRLLVPKEAQEYKARTVCVGSKE